ncbi:MAG: hypothetical protein KKB59_17165, partial [Spirochaetes bacterium]|nr:hypothetical protein [Spirochaetota bacterium]
MYVCAPLVVTAPPFSTTVPAASVVRDKRLCVDPTAPPNVVAPLPFTVSVLLLAARSAFTVPANAIAVPLSTVFAPSVTASDQVCVPVVASVPDTVTPPPP